MDVVSQIDVDDCCCCCCCADWDDGWCCCCCCCGVTCVCAMLFDDAVCVGEDEVWGCPHVNKFTIDFFFLMVVVGVPCWFDDCNDCGRDCCVMSFFTPWIESGVEVVVDKNE